MKKLNVFEEDALLLIETYNPFLTDPGFEDEAKKAQLMQLGDTARGKNAAKIKSAAIWHEAMTGGSPTAALGRSTNTELVFQALLAEVFQHLKNISPLDWRVINRLSADLQRLLQKAHGVGTGEPAGKLYLEFIECISHLGRVGVGEKAIDVLQDINNISAMRLMDQFYRQR